MNENIRVIKCPKCNSKNFHGRNVIGEKYKSKHNVDKHNMDNGVLWGLYCCNVCGTDFDVKYIANDICFANPDDSKDNIIKLQF